MIRTALSVVMVLGIAVQGFAQGGGRSAYEFLEIPTTSRIAAMGGDLISINDSDLSLIAENPAVLSESLHNTVLLSYINYIGDINMGQVAYARTFDRVGTLAAGLQFMNYGKFWETDVYGTKNRQISAGDYAVNISYARKLHSFFRVGANLKFVFSELFTVYSIGMAVDVAGLYTSKNNSTSAGIVIKNFGMELKPYVAGRREPLPFEIQLGVSQKLAKAPFRVSATWKNLQRWSMTYQGPGDPDPEIDPITQKEIVKTVTFDNIMKHILLGVEFMPSNVIHLRMAYNYQRQQELKLADKAGISGFSFGLGIRISKISISYSLSAYHLSRSANHFTLSTNLADWYKKAMPVGGETDI